MNRNILLVWAALLANFAFAAEFDSVGCTTENCRKVEFKSVGGANIRVQIKMAPRKIEDGKIITPLKIDVEYEDVDSYFRGASKLYHYVGLEKSKTMTSGNSSNTHLDSESVLESVGEKKYQGQFSYQLEGKVGEFRETLSALALAFTDTYPFSPQGKWDSDHHKNYFIWAAMGQ